MADQLAGVLHRLTGSEPVAIPGCSGLVPIGIGGFSTVYRAHQDRFARTVAVKVLHASLADAAAQRRFLRECSIAGAASSHPHCVTVLDAGLTNLERPYIVFEHMGGGTLSDRLTASGPLDPAEVLSHGVKLCGALATVHRAGILHRDIKPLNVLFSDFDEPCLTDFGISAMVKGPATPSMTNSMTPLFTAPEVLDGAPSSVASDLYSLAATLYCVLAGRAPHEPREGEGLRSLLARLSEDPVGPIGRSDVPTALDHLLRSAMSADPTGRGSGAEGLGEELRGIQAAIGGTADRMILGTVVTDPVGDIEVVLRPAGHPRPRIVIDLPPEAQI